MNSNKFSWDRFGKVVRHDLGTLPSQYGVMLLVLALLPAAIWLLLLVMSGLKGVTPIAPSTRLVFIVVLALLAACLTPARLYRTSNMPNEGIYFAMLPASKLEKYLSMLLFSLVVCPLMVMVGAVAMDLLLGLLPFGSYCEPLFNSDSLNYVTDDPYFDNTAFLQVLPGSLALLVMLGYVELVALFLFAATFFKKYKFLKSILALWVLRFVLTLAMIPILAYTAMHGDFSSNPFEAWSGADNIVDLFQYGVGICLVVVAVVDALLIWAAGFRYKKMKY